MNSFRIDSRVRADPFVGYRFPPEVIVLAVRWYPRYGLSYRDVEELFAERSRFVVSGWSRVFGIDTASKM